MNKRDFLRTLGGGLSLALLPRTLFAAVHGIVTIGLEERLVAVPLSALEAQIEWLVRATCRGLREA